MGAPRSLLRGSRRQRRFWAMIAVVAALIGLMAATVRLDAWSGPATALGSAVAPAAGVFSGAYRGASRLEQRIGGLWSLQAQNRKLRQQVAQLQQQLLRQGQLRAENSHLRALVHLQSASSTLGLGRGIAAAVIGRSPDAWFRWVTVDKGTAAGVRAGMIAMSPGGLIGRVESGVGPTTARILLVTDPSFGVGVLDPRHGSGAEGVAVGRLGSQSLRATFFSPNAKVRVGDTLVTSGLNGGYPSGLPLGVVTRVFQGDFGLVRQATVHPSAHLEALAYVLLLPARGGAG